MNKKSIILLLVSIILLFSCTTTAPSEDNNDTVESQPVETQGESEERVIPEIRTMDQLPRWIFDSTPVDGHPRFVVFTTRRADREEEEERTLQMAALEAAKYRGIFVSAKELSQRGNANFGYANDIYIQYQEDMAPQYLDDLELDEIIRTPEGTFARYIFTAGSSNVNYSIETAGTPSWVSQAPELPGYIVIIGAVERHRNWAESFKAADEAALAQMAYSLFGQVDNQFETMQQGTSTRTQTGTLGTILIQGEGTVQKVTVLSRWVDEYGLYYSLLATPINQ